MFHIVDDSALSTLCCPRAPDQPVQEQGKDRGAIRHEPLDDVRVPLEERIGAKVVTVTIRTNCQQILNDGRSSIQTASFQGPQQGRNRLGADLHVQDPQRSLPPRGAGDSSPQLPCGVRVDGLHSDGGTLHDDACQDSGHQVQGPSKGLQGLLRGCQGMDDSHTGRDKRPEEVCGNAVSNVAKAQGRNVFHHLLGLAIHVQRH
mmetsp:Transcript_96227/g.201027  ORF Transcript_96227/g.201027 Transcript_96227/m.201027 type:complete len:203 (+) Transcript_96227:1401-2009(+)